MPEEMNGIGMLDKTKDFCKENCFWDKKKCGRPPNTEAQAKPPKQKKRRSLLDKPKYICLAVEHDLIDYIGKQAMHRSIEERKFITSNDLIREALTSYFPYQGQMQMFS